MSTGPEPLLRCEGVAKTYTGATPVAALRPATFSVAKGEHIAICGPSGSGKSTLMNILGLLDIPTSGLYELRGRSVSTMGERERSGVRATVIGFVFQSFHLVPDRAAIDNVAMGMLYLGVPRRERLDRAKRVLDRVGLSHRRDVDVATMSGGERQRVAIARAIVHEPELLLADEPTGNLDSGMSKTVLDVLEHLNNEGLTQVIVTHDHAVADRASRRLMVRDGWVTDPGSIA